MKKDTNRRDIVLWRATVAMLSVSSLSLAIFALFANIGDEMFQSPLAYIIAVVFWLFLILGYYSFSRIAALRKVYEKKHKKAKIKKHYPGFITFFSNSKAALADIMLGISFVLTLVFLFIPSMNQRITIFFAAIMVFSLHMHSIYNGVNYRYIQYLNKAGDHSGKKESKL